MLDVSQFASNQTVTFAVGLRRDIAAHADRAGAARVFVLTTPRQSGLGSELVDALGDRAVGVFSKAAMHTPVEVTEEARAHLAELEADCVLAAGGGSTIGLGKALALRTGVKQLPSSLARTTQRRLFGPSAGHSGPRWRSRISVSPRQISTAPPRSPPAIPIGIRERSRKRAFARSSGARGAERPRPPDGVQRTAEQPTGHLLRHGRFVRTARRNQMAGKPVVGLRGGLSSIVGRGDAAVIAAE